MQIEELEQKLNANWPAIRKAKDTTARQRKSLEEAFKGRVASDTTVVLFGSIARKEMTRGSDTDWILLVDGQAFPERVSLVLYDLTSVYFEGKGPAGLGTYGYSRDHRPERPQVLLAVATDSEGVPIHVEVQDPALDHGLLLRHASDVCHGRHDVRHAP